MLVLIIESRWTDGNSIDKREFPVEQNSTCRNKDTLEIVRECEPCTGKNEFCVYV